jgi:hypothetical protein
MGKAAMIPEGAWPSVWFQYFSVASARRFSAVVVGNPKNSR